MFSEFEISLMGKQKQRLQAITWFLFFFQDWSCCLLVAFSFFFLNNWGRSWELGKAVFRLLPRETVDSAYNSVRNWTWSRLCVCVCMCVPQCVCISTFCKKECIKPGKAERAVRTQLYLCIVYLVFFHFPLRGWRGCCNFQNTAKNISTNCCACLPTYIKQRKISEGTLQHKTPFFFFLHFL